MFAGHRNWGLAPKRGEHAPAYPTFHCRTRGLAALLALTMAAATLGLGSTAAANTVESRVSTSTDDAEEFASGSMYLNSTTLQMVLYNGGNQTVGMRWASLAIPPGATITAAYIQFTAKEAQSDSTYLYIRGQAADNAPTFATGANNISSRPRTTATTTWQPLAWTTVGAAGAAQRTPDLTAVIREVVGRPGWADGNALDIIINGIGLRTAYTWDGSATLAPLLHVDFTPPTNPTALLSVTQLPTPSFTVRADGSASIAGTGGAIASYTFNFGDGSAPVTTTAPTAASQHTYAAAGTYTITLTATDVANNVSPPATTSFIVRTDTAPVAHLTLSQLATPALTVKADGSTSTDTDYAPIASYTFNFGDGTAPVTTTAPTATAPHTYAAASTYTVTLTATDAAGLTSAPATGSITVQADAPPVARVTATQTGTLTVVADGSTSTDTDLTPIASYRFTFGDGTAAVTTTAPTTTATHAYATAGTYTITLVATDAGGLASAPATTSVVVTATDSPPVARLAVTASGLTASADGSGSTDADATPIASYRFDFGDGSAAVTATAPTATTSHTYAAAGTYTVTLIATDTGGNASSPVTASVSVPPPSIAYVGRIASATVSTTSTSTTLNATRQVLAGDAIVVAVLLSSTNLTSTVGVTDAAGNAYIPDRDQNDGSGGDRTLVFSSKNAKPLASGGTIILTYPSAAECHATADEFSGIVATDKVASATGSASSFSSGATTTTAQPAELLYGALGQESGNVPTWAAGWNGLSTLSISTDRLTSAYQLVSATGTYAASGTGGGTWMATIVTYSATTGPVDNPPVARLTVTPNGLAVTADGSGSTDTDATPIASYRFAWGDGTAAVTTNAPTATAQHTYAAAGTYTVTLIATDTGGLVSTAATTSVTVVQDAPPTARVSLSQLASPALTVNADASGSSDPDATPIASCRFDFGDGSAAVSITPPATSAQHTYAAAGTYTVSMIATDTGGLSSTAATASITVQAEQVPTARLTVAPVASPPLTVRADASTSTDPDYTPIASYRFDFGDGTAAVTTTAPTASAPHTYAAAGTYTVTLIATDSGGNASTAASTSVTVAVEAPPTARLTASQLVTPALTVGADGSASTDGDPTPIASYRFTFGDGTAAVTTTAPTASAPHTYAAAGTYTVTLIATDTGGNASTAATASVTVVADNPPTARLTVTQLGNPAFTVAADASASTDADLTPIASYRFSFGDGTAAVTTSAPTATAQHTYAGSGSFTVTVTATDSAGNVSAPATATVAVLGKISTERMIAASSDDAEQRQNGSVNLTSSTLQLVVDGSNQQVVGLRWPGIPIAKGTGISAAYVQFTASAAQSGTTALTINGQAADNAATFTTTSNSISTRPRTTASVAWSPNAWTSGQAGADQRTPDLSAVIQEIVNRSGWASGNALALVVTGTGSRTAYTFDGSSTQAAVLHIEYVGVATPPTARLAVTPVGLSATADGSASTPGDNPIASYRFDFGDGTPPVTTTAPTATAPHTYAAAGTYTVSLVVTDTNGRSSAPATASVTVAQPTSGPIAVYVGYYDTHHADYLRTKPDPWYGSSGIQFVGTPDSNSGGWDSSGIRIDNLSSGSISVTVTIDMGSSHFGLWSSRTVAAGGTLVLAQTGYENFDGSDTNPAGCYGCDPKLCTTEVQSTIPVVHVTMNGTTTDYYDTGQISNTHGVDMAGCPYTGTRNDESQVWTQIYPQAPAAMMTSQGRARTESEAALAPTRRLYFGPVFPNPAGAQLTLRYVIPTQQDVELALFDVSGRRIRTHLNEDLDPGEYQSVMDIAELPAGMYYIRLAAGGRFLQQRFVHIR